ncbi:MAG: ABC transporter ATP-binding protein [bacterium]
MSDIALVAAGLGKRYQIGLRRTRYRTLRETLQNVVLAPWRGRRSDRRRGNPSGIPQETIWALADLTFEVRHGEAVGIIGRNGAGKSTLLKILSRITEPTTGRAEVHGRVGSLLEVGTGFHAELTGQENIFLNGAILGMKRREVVRKFDEIVAFAEVGRFIDTPVKHYSSGMYLRLAFAVAAHLDPEILLVDEVLAVGDANFQKKCLRKMEDVTGRGRTILFVSHNMPAITRLCDRAILLDGGRVVFDGPSSEAVRIYLSGNGGTPAARTWPAAAAPGKEIARLRAVRVKTEAGPVMGSVDIRRPVRVEMEFDVLKPGYVMMPHFHFNNEEGIRAFSSYDVDPEWQGRPRPAGRYVSVVEIPGNFLGEGMMFVNAGLRVITPNIVEFFEVDAVAFQVVDSRDGDSARGLFAGTMLGVVRPKLSWTTAFAPVDNAHPV